jgi:hypothetical protein
VEWKESWSFQTVFGEMDCKAMACRDRRGSLMQHGSANALALALGATWMYAVGPPPAPMGPTACTAVSAHLAFLFFLNAAPHRLGNWAWAFVAIMTMLGALLVCGTVR